MSLSYLWYALGYDEEFTPDPEIKRIRHELMKQVKLSKVKLSEIKDLPPLKLIREIPIYHNETVLVSKKKDTDSFDVPIKELLEILETNDEKLTPQTPQTSPTRSKLQSPILNAIEKQITQPTTNRPP